MNTDTYTRFKEAMNEAEEKIISSELNGANIHDMGYEQLVMLIASFNVKLGALKTLMNRLHQAKSELLSKEYYEKTGIKCGSIVECRETIYSVEKIEWYDTSTINSEPKCIYANKLKKDGTPSKSSERLFSDIILVK